MKPQRLLVVFTSGTRTSLFWVSEPMTFGFCQTHSHGCLNGDLWFHPVDVALRPWESIGCWIFFGRVSGVRVGRADDPQSLADRSWAPSRCPCCAARYRGSARVPASRAKGKRDPGGFWFQSFRHKGLLRGKQEVCSEIPRFGPEKWVPGNLGREENTFGPSAPGFFPRSESYGVDRPSSGVAWGMQGLRRFGSRKFRWSGWMG